MGIHNQQNDAYINEPPGLAALDGSEHIPGDTVTGDPIDVRVWQIKSYVIGFVGSDAEIGSNFGLISGTGFPGWNTAIAPSSFSASAGQVALSLLPNTGFSYQRQLNDDLEVWAATKTNGRLSFTLSGLRYFNGKWASNLDLYFGLYADDLGAPDADKFHRIHLKWDGTIGEWMIRAEEKDGTTLTVGAWNSINTFPLMQNLSLRVTIYDDNNSNVYGLYRAYVGVVENPNYHEAIMSDSTGRTAQFGRGWLRFHGDKSSGWPAAKIGLSGFDKSEVG